MRATIGWRHAPRLVVFLLLVAAAVVPGAPPVPAAPLAACAPRPNVGVSVTPGPAGTLQVVITASTNASTPTNTLTGLSFGAATGALIDVPGQPAGQTGNFTVPLAAAQTTFTVRQATPGQAATVPLTVTDTCGTWPTLVGGGPNAFPSATPGGPAPTATATPSPTRTPTKPPSLAVGQASIGVSTPEPVVWSDIPAPTALDWIGMFVPGSLDTNYVGGPRFTGSTAPGGTTDFGIPADVAAGTYEMRLYADKGTGRLAQSGLFTVSRPAPTPIVGAGPPAVILAPAVSVDTAGDVGRHAALALTNSNPNIVADDVPVISYYDATNHKLKVWLCGDPGCATFTSFASPDGTPDNGQYTSIVFDANGLPVVSYYDVANGKLKVLHCGVVTCSNPAGCNLAAGQICIVSPDSSPNNGQFTSLKLDASGNPVVSYYDVAATRLKVLRCGNPTCTSGNSIAMPDTTSANNGQFTTLQLDAGGRPVVSYYDTTNQGLKLLHCGNVTCTSGNLLVTVDAIGNVGQHTSLALDAFGNPVISYYDATNQRLKLAHCSDANCASPAVISAPDPATGVGQYTSLRLDMLGRPVVSYFDAALGRLKVLHCSNPSCTAAGTHTINVADTGNVGQFTALALDKNLTGENNVNPVVAYFDAANQDLKLIHCSSPTCATTPDDDSDVGQFSSLRLSGGNPTVSYYDASQGKLTVLRCGNAACSTPRDFSLPPNPCPANMSCIVKPDNSLSDTGRGGALVLDGGGLPVVSYLSAANSTSNGGLSILRCGDAACRSGNIITIPIPVNTGTVGPSTSITLDGLGNPVVSYYDAVALKLKVLHCANATCSGAVVNGSPASPCPGGSNCLATPDTTGNVGQYSSIQIDNLGRPVVSYYDATAGRLKVLRCGDANCTSAGNVIAAPDTTSANNGLFTSLQLDANNFAVVSYQVGALGPLKLLRCGDANCTAATASVTTVDASASVGAYTSLALDASSNPVIGYYDITNGDLRIAHCGNGNCTSGNVIVSADTLSNRPPSPPAPPAGFDNVGRFTSLALDGGGNPIVSYWDATNADLKVLRCRSTTCR